MLYRGFARPGNRGLVVVEHDDGQLIGPLPHRGKHSPGGLSWGDGSASSSDLARSLLIHALDASCDTCAGSGLVCLELATDAETPASVAAERGGNLYSQPMRCLDCDNGDRIAHYLSEHFKAAVVAGLPAGQDWTMSRAAIQVWAARQNPTSKMGWRSA